LVKRNALISYLLVPILFFSCTPVYKKYISAYRISNPSVAPDYSRPEYWAALPLKQDPSDSVPLPLRSSFVKDSGVDVFFLHPTTFGSKEDTAWNADINDPVVNAKTDYTTILYQASAFNECRIYAPRYRQANIRAYFTKDTTGAVRAFDLAYADLAAAFQYYLDHYNHGRPIIIASHSQGSTHAQRLLREFFENKPLQHQLVAAYIIGMAIPKNYFTALSPCLDSAQTGCIIGWRTFRKGYEPEFVKLEEGNSLVTNPLSWTNSSDYADKEKNLGAVLSKFNTVLTGVADAQIHGDILWIHKPHFPGGIFYRSKNYHIGDINLFYVNIRQNIRTRIRNYRKS
jgi:Protein of unknown function (DUF3089)